MHNLFINAPFTEVLECACIFSAIKSKSQAFVNKSVKNGDFGAFVSSFKHFKNTFHNIIISN